jgi:hypothetical protein
MKMLKSVGRSGQIFLGKQYAGKTVMIEQIETGVCLLKIGEFIPVSERWLHDPAVSQDLNEAIVWAEKHSPQDSDMSALFPEIECQELR